MRYNETLVCFPVVIFRLLAAANSPRGIGSLCCIISLQLSVYLQNIPSCSDPEQCLGALAMGESFVDSVIAVDTGLDTQCLILTSDVPAVVSWPVRLEHYGAFRG